MKEGLTKSFVDFRIYSCGSGVVYDESSHSSFASLLAKELRRLGYKSIHVTGYLGNLRAGYSTLAEEKGPSGDYASWWITHAHKSVEQIGSHGGVKFGRLSENKIVV